MDNNNMSGNNKNGHLMDIAKNVQFFFKRVHRFFEESTKSINGIYIVLIGIIICFAVIICLMFTLMRSMIDGGNKKSDNTENNLYISETTDTIKSEIQIMTSENTQTAIPAVTTAVSAETAPEVVTVTVIVTVTEPSFQPYQYKVNNVGLVVYENAGFDSKPIDYISDRGTYTIVDQYQNWGKLKSGGWINFDVASETGGVTYLGIGEIVTKKDPLNMRSAPDSDAKILTSIPKGKKVEIYESEFSDWYYTTYNGKSGFVSSEYISFENYHVTEIKEYYGYGVINTKKDPLNVRSEPSTNASVVTTIPKGTTVELYTTIYDGWFYTTYNGKSGYVSSQYISNVLAEDVQDSSTAYINTKNDPLNLRKSASTSGAVITTIPKGSAVTVIEYGDSWCYIEWNGYKGYASTDYLLF